MATIITTTHIDADPDAVWEALRDFGEVHHRLVPGFVVEARLERGARIVTFGNGAVAREVLVGVDDDARRLAYAVVDAPTLGFTHHNASAQVFADGDGGCRFVWIADVLPDDVASTVEVMMEQGSAVIKQTMESPPER